MILLRIIWTLALFHCSTGNLFSARWFSWFPSAKITYPFIFWRNRSTSSKNTCSSLLSQNTNPKSPATNSTSPSSIFFAIITSAAVSPWRSPVTSSLPVFSISFLSSSISSSFLLFICLLLYLSLWLLFYHIIFSSVFAKTLLYAL